MPAASSAPCSREERRRSSGWRRRPCLPAKRSTSGSEAARLVHRAVDVEAVAHAGQVVVPAVAGRGVHEAGAGVEGDVVAEHAGASRGRARDGGSARPPRPAPFISASGAPSCRSCPFQRAPRASRSALASSRTSRVPSTGIERVVGVGMEGDREVGRAASRAWWSRSPRRRGGPASAGCALQLRRARRRRAGSARRSTGSRGSRRTRPRPRPAPCGHEMHQCTDFLAL